MSYEETYDKEILRGQLLVMAGFVVAWFLVII
jgi:hypothetical protein